MKRMFILLVAVLFVFAYSVTANAALIDNGDGTITDDDLGIMWLQSPGPDADYANALAWAGSLVFATYDDWRLPSALDFDTGMPDEVWNSVNNEFGHLYGVELGNPANAGDQGVMSDYTPLWYWTDTADPDSPGDAFMFFWSWDGLWLNQSTADRADSTTSSIIHVTAVRDVDGVIPVPEPSTILLLGSGLFGLGLLRKKFIRK